MKQRFKEVLFVIILFIVDIISKVLIENNLELYESIDIIKGFFSITYAQNTGAAWSIMEGKMIFFYIITIIGLVFMYYLYKNAKDNTIEKYAVLMMIGGTLGNLYDRVLYQYVRDFLDFIIFGYDFPVFNFADTFLCCGVFIYIVKVLYDEYNLR